MTSLIDEIAAERKRQIDVEGWDAEHDDHHDRGELAKAAAAYAFVSALQPHQVAWHTERMHRGVPESILRRLWPWDMNWWKPKDPRRDLIRAAALIVAEIERLDRALAAQKPGGE